MYIRKVKSRNSICFQIGKKQYGKFKLIEHIGCAQEETEIEALRLNAQQKLWQIKFEDQLSLFPQKKTPRAKLTEKIDLGKKDILKITAATCRKFWLVYV